MEVIVGTYEHYLLGYKLIKEKQDYKLQQTFACQAHIGPIRCIATSHKFLVSGGIDETIQIFNLKTKKEIGNIVQHSGTITCLSFFKDSHLFSSSEDGTICVWSSSNWKCLKTLKGHK
ncbi:p21-activated protein kinase-interacting protein 1-like [Centruroides sculpturatus]|nr:p21-activated protein kinase-interacting protein 1-like [Centruroides sculpturatus]